MLIDLDALGPDGCRADHSLARYYWHLNVKALNGGRSKLSARELEFVA